MMFGSEFDRRDSRKRHRVSERRRVFSRIGPSGDHQRMFTGDGSLSTEKSSWSGSSTNYNCNNTNANATITTIEDQQQSTRSNSRSDSPLGDNNKILMKIQFQITVAQESDPLILDSSSLVSQLNSGGDSSSANTPQSSGSGGGGSNRKKSTTESIGDQIHERLTRQNTASTRRRQQLLAMHNQTALEAAAAAAAASSSGGATNKNKNNNCNQANASTGGGGGGGGGNEHYQVSNSIVHSADNLASTTTHRRATSNTADIYGDKSPPIGRRESSSIYLREPGVRSSTITSGMADEATMEFLARTRAAAALNTNDSTISGSQLGSGASSPLVSATAIAAAAAAAAVAGGGGVSQTMREQIYYKRDGQRFGHEFTLKLAVDRTYRCLLKVRPLIPIQGISIQGHHVPYVDCSPTSSGAQAVSSLSSASAPTSLAALNRSSWQNVHTNTQTQTHNKQHHHLNHRSQTTAINKASYHHNNISHQNHQRNLSQAPLLVQNNKQLYSSGKSHHGGGIGHTSVSLDAQLLARSLLYQQQQSQMLRHFSANSSSSNPHLGGQLVYMFDWSGNRFEVNKNKDRTQIHVVLKFKNGQILSLPLQIKFYQSECKQHLNWGSQLHFIDYDCSINSFGLINVDRIHFY